MSPSFLLPPRDRRRRAGLTLIELVISIVVISVALVGVMLVIDMTTRHSADPMLEGQAVAVAEAYLEEVLLKSYSDPGTSGVCPAPPASRSLFDNVCDYDGLDDSPPRDQHELPIGGLDSYRVRVTVDQAATLFDINGSADVLRVDVRVTHATGIDYTLSGYRTNY